MERKNKKKGWKKKIINTEGGSVVPTHTHETKKKKKEKEERHTRHKTKKKEQETAVHQKNV